MSVVRAEPVLSDVPNTLDDLLVPRLCFPDLFGQLLARLALHQQLSYVLALFFFGFIFPNPTADNIRTTIDRLVSISRIPDRQRRGSSPQTHFFICSSFSIRASSLKWAFCSADASRQLLQALETHL